MKSRVTVLVLLLLATGASSAMAATACGDAYYKCLNDTWDTSGLARFFANRMCEAAYIQCVSGSR